MIGIWITTTVQRTFPTMRLLTIIHDRTASELRTRFLPMTSSVPHICPSSIPRTIIIVPVKTTLLPIPQIGQDRRQAITEAILRDRIELCRHHLLRPTKSLPYVSHYCYTLLSSLSLGTLICASCIAFASFSLSSVSGSNLASHMVGSLKKGSKQSMSLPSTAYNTLPAHVHHMRSTTSSPRVIAGQSKKHHHKRSPSSDSGTGSNTPVSSYHSGKVHHTVFLHGRLREFIHDIRLYYTRLNLNKFEIINCNVLILQLVPNLAEAQTPHHQRCKVLQKSRLQRISCKLEWWTDNQQKV